MILNYKTSKLPLNFLFLGAFLLIISIWRLFLFDWIGIIVLLTSLVCLFLRSGIQVDIKNKKLKSYIGLFTVRIGDWENISTAKHLSVVKANVTQKMNVLTIGRTESSVLYKLILVLPNKKIVLISGEQEFITKIAEEISTELQISLLR